MSRLLVLPSLAIPLLFFSAVVSAQPAAESMRLFERVRSLAFEKSPEIRLARSRFEQKHAARYSSLAAWAPRFDLRLSQTISKDYTALTSGSLGAFAELFRPEEVNLSAYQLVVQAPLYNRSVHVGVRKSDAELRLAETELELARSQVTWNLRQVFGNYLLQAYKLSTVDRSLKLARSNLQEAQLRFRLGSRTVIDVLKAQAQLAQLEARQVTFESDKAQALSQLLQYTGLTEAELKGVGIDALTGAENSLSVEIESFAETPSLLSEIAMFPTEREALSRAIETESGVLRRIREQSEVEEAQANALAASEWPELLVRGTLGKQTDVWGRTLSTGETSYSYGLILNIPLFSFGRSLYLKHESSELVRTSEIKRRRASDDLLSNVQNLTLKGRALAKSIESLRLGVERNTEIERLTNRSYQLGKSSFLDLQIAQNDLLDSKIQLAQAQVDLAVLIWQIRWNLGTATEASK